MAFPRPKPRAPLRAALTRDFLRGRKPRWKSRVRAPTEVSQLAAAFIDGGKAGSSV